MQTNQADLTAFETFGLNKSVKFRKILKEYVQEKTK
jgi:hypothetical protein